MRKEGLSSLGKAASHRQRNYGEEGPDDRRSASKGEKERFSYRLLLYVQYISNRFNCGPGYSFWSDVTFTGGQKITRQAAALRLLSEAGGVSGKGSSRALTPSSPRLTLLIRALTRLTRAQGGDAHPPEQERQCPPQVSLSPTV
jgi:hypothetical protein